jgi:nucleoside-diphosphate-sugar epimerase
MNATKSLHGKRVLVTGGTGNVGWGIAVAAQETNSVSPAASKKSPPSDDDRQSTLRPGDDNEGPFGTSVSTRS